jgi:hypothetical protein
MPKRKAAGGHVPTIACINIASVELGVDFDKLIRALQKFVDHHFAPVWGTPAKLVKATKPLPGAWVLVLLDSADRTHRKALGYHKRLINDLPVAKVFVIPTIEGGEKVSVVASHELAEMLVDPAGNLWSANRYHTFYAYEVCDAVEEEVFKIDGIEMSDFVYPAYYEPFRKPNSVQFDHLKRVTRPFQVLANGYAKARKNGKVVTMFHTKAKKQRFAKEDRRQHRTEYRK